MTLVAVVHQNRPNLLLKEINAVVPTDHRNAHDDRRETQYAKVLLQVQHVDEQGTEEMWRVWQGRTADCTRARWNKYKHSSEAPSVNEFHASAWEYRGLPHRRRRFSL
jgi:hypothetical protein